jgi:hypothetical protein
MHFLFSESIIILLKKLSQDACSILNNEIGLDSAKCRGRNISFEKGRYRYSLSLVLFEGQQEWGFFNGQLMEIGLNKKLFLLDNPNIVGEVLRHELAHFYQHVFEEDAEGGHNPLFRSICRRFFKNEDIGKASLSWENLEQENTSKDKKRIFEKVKKLLALSESSNPFEAEMALKKVNQMILEHNLQHISDIDNEYQNIYLARIYQAKRFSTKIQAIREILDLFQVRSILNHGMAQSYLEIIGSMESIQIAEYVFHFLEHEFEKLWERERKELGLKGRVAKNSFFRGLSEGFKTQILKGQAQVPQKSLIISEKALDLSVRKLVYPRLRLTHSRFKEDHHARGQGKLRGEQLKIVKGVESKRENVRLLNFFKP